jgi:hypothetical protein
MTGHIYTAEDKYREIPGLEGLTPPERVVARFWPLFRFQGLPKTHAGKLAYAEVRQGQWLVSCPYCPGAQYASKTDHRFFCDECGNNGDGWSTVVWPDVADEIESIVGRRPDRNTRDWLVGETVEQLQDENDAHDVH